MKSFVVILALLVIPSISEAVLINSGTAELPGTFTFDFETGTVGGGDDIAWRQLDLATRQIDRPLGESASFVALGAVGFGSVTEANLLGFAYSATPIPGPPGGTDLDVGDVFAVMTDDGNFAKVIVTDYDNGIADRPFYDMHFRFELYNGVAVPEPSAALLLGSVSAGIVMIRRFRSLNMS